MKRSNEMRFIVVGLALIAAIGAWAGLASAQSPSIAVKNAWVRPASKSVGTSAFYALIVNTGTVDDRLVSAETPEAGMAQLHESTKDADGMTHMHEVTGGLTVPAHGQVELKPGNYHLMLMELHSNIKAGAIIPVTLHFEKAGAIVVKAKAENRVGGKKAEGGMSGMSGMPGMDMKH